MKKRKEVKEGFIEMRLVSIESKKFNVEDAEYDEAKVLYNNDFHLSFYVPNNDLNVVITTTIFDKEGGKSFITSEISVKFLVFKMEEFAANGKLNLPNEILTSLMEISIGSVRGYLSALLAPTKHRNLVLPILDIPSIIATKK